LQIKLKIENCKLKEGNGPIPQLKFAFFNLQSPAPPVPSCLHAFSELDSRLCPCFNPGMNDPRTAYESLISELKEIALLSSVASVLGWDERTQLPTKGTEHRARQSALLAKMIHQRFTATRIGDLLSTVEQSPLVADPLSDEAVNARETRRSYDRARKLPTALVEELTSTAVLAQQVWGEARKESNYGIFEPWLAKTLVLKQQEAECIGHGGDPYDALLDEFEPGETAEGIRRTFEALRGPLVELIGKVAGSKRKAPVEILQRQYPSAAQEKLARQAAAAIGFDFAAGRLDVSLHPFCTDLGPGDTRMTTRYDPKRFGDSLFGVLHETGHGLYTQGLDPAHFGTPRGSYVSLGIHESQSRLWENLVGRTASFWKWFLPQTREAFPQSLQGVSEEEWTFAINEIHPSLIRVEADEATYNLHIMLRFELERAMLRGELSSKDLPAAWKVKMLDYLGVTPDNDAAGCLQDIHWSGGAIGYFPTYTLGNLYAAQFFEQAQQDLGELHAQFAAGQFGPLLAWLREKIHRHGKRFTGPQLVRHVTGKPLSAEPLMRHLRAKAQTYYRV
jgi:carboxypeptidase Taq